MARPSLLLSLLLLVLLGTLAWRLVRPGDGLAPEAPVTPGPVFVLTVP